MKGVAPPSKRDFEASIAKRMFIPPGGRPKSNFKRFNRVGVAGAHTNSLVAEDEGEQEDGHEPSAFGRKTKATAAAKKGKKAKGNNSGSSATSTSSSSTTPDLTLANPPTANNSLGLDIECVWLHNVRV